MNKQKLSQINFKAGKHTWSARSDWTVEILPKSPWTVTCIVVVVGHGDRLKRYTGSRLSVCEHED